nr:hypothetical protein CFP56_65197 [Quercus suber]
MARVLSQLTLEPRAFSDSCASLSWPLITALTTRLPVSPELVLSVGCGAGLLEAMLLHATQSKINIRGVEVLSCANKHLPAQNFWQVATTMSIHPDAVLASALMFVYPRQPTLIARYLETCMSGAVEQVIWLGHRSDWPDASSLLQKFFTSLEYTEGPAVAAYELLVIASEPRSMISQ